MAISTYGVFLMHRAKSTSDWEKLIDITEFPDLGGEPEMIETTTLSDGMQTYIAGIEGSDSLSFSANYTLEDFKKLEALEGLSEDYAVWFGGEETRKRKTPDGAEGKFQFEGQLSVYVNSGKTNEAVSMTVTVVPNSPIECVE